MHVLAFVNSVSSSSAINEINACPTEMMYFLAPNRSLCIDISSLMGAVLLNACVIIK